MKFTENSKIIAKKQHACGANCWTIIRVGADIKLKCDGCGKILILSHDETKKIIKTYIDENGKVCKD